MSVQSRIPWRGRRKPAWREWEVPHVKALSVSPGVPKQVFHERGLPGARLALDPEQAAIAAKLLHEAGAVLQYPVERTLVRVFNPMLSLVHVGLLETRAYFWGVVSEKNSTMTRH